jgi:hypothetical protein
LLASAGRTTRLGSSLVRIQAPVGRQPIDPSSATRYIARIQVPEAESDCGGTAGRPAAEVVRTLFGVYLDWPTAHRPSELVLSHPASAAA